MSRGDKAKSYFLEGYNCSQSVALAFADMLDMDKRTIARAVSGFGGGMGRMREVCGAMSGISFVISMLYGYESASDTEGKKRLYSEIQVMGNRFKEDNGSVVCRELLGLEKSGFDHPVPAKRTESYYQKRPCKELVKYAADILEEYINSRNINN